jgi:hypothetical protein
MTEFLLTYEFGMWSVLRKEPDGHVSTVTQASSLEEAIESASRLTGGPVGIKLVAR